MHGRMPDLDVDSPDAGPPYLTALVFAVPTVGPTVAEARLDAPDAANLYPGRYTAVCIPAPMFGCVCTADPLGEALMLHGGYRVFADDRVVATHLRLARRDCPKVPRTNLSSQNVKWRRGNATTQRVL